MSPGNWLGVLGGGQLGRMFSHSAQRLGYRVAIFEDNAECPAGQVCSRFFDASRSPEETVVEMAKLCQSITIEFENIDANLLELAEKHCHVRPGPDFLRLCQDRISEKTRLTDAGFPTTPFRAASTLVEAHTACEELGYPVILKTARSGYDGKGQAKVTSADALPEAWQSINNDRVIVEKMIDFTAEVSMITARNDSGETICYPILENKHTNHILDISSCPAAPQLERLHSDAVEICQGIANRFGVIGLFCVEFFVTQQGSLLINEIAPRPHNSGHLTIEAFSHSQFDLQVRAICDLPLPQPVQLRPAAMANLLGDVWNAGEPNWNSVLARENASLHLYGKLEPKPARKMGHLTVLGETVEAAEAEASALQAALAGK